jgi:hypothetical protein
VGSDEYNWRPFLILSLSTYRAGFDCQKNSRELFKLDKIQ